MREYDQKGDREQFHTATGSDTLTAMTVYDFQSKTIDGREISLSDYKGKVLLIVNVASRCGFTPQYSGLQKLYDEHKQGGF